MAQIHAGTPHTARRSRRARAHSEDLPARELRAWKERSLAVETEGAPAWPKTQSAKLVEAMVGAALGENPVAVDGPARAWARTNPSLTVLARRLGALRAGFGTQLSPTDPTMRARLAEVVDAAAVASTAEWLACLGLAPVPMDAAPSNLTSSRPPIIPPAMRTSRRLRDAGVAVLAGAAAAAAVIALAAAPPASRGHTRAIGHVRQPTPSLVQPPAGGRRTVAVGALVRTPTTGGPASGRAVRGGGGSFATDVGSSGGSTAPSPANTGPPAPLPATPPTGVPLPSLPLPSVPSVPPVASLASAAASAGSASPPGVGLASL